MYSSDNDMIVIGSSSSITDDLIAKLNSIFSQKWLGSQDYCFGFGFEEKRMLILHHSLTREIELCSSGKSQQSRGG
jgi:hypothetical protein